MRFILTGLLLIAVNVVIAVINDVTWWTVVGVAASGFSIGVGFAEWNNER